MSDAGPFDNVLSQLSNSVELSYARTDGSDPEEPERVVAVVSFSEKGFGFGEVTIIQTKEGCFIDSEYMSTERVKKILCALVDSAVLDTNTDPEKHALFNRVRGRYCGSRCNICYPTNERGEST